MFTLFTTLVATDRTHGTHGADALGSTLTFRSTLRALTWRRKEQRPIALASRMLEPIARRDVLDLQECRGRGIDFCGGHGAQCGGSAHCA